MRPKTILVCLTTPENAETLMKCAVPLARKHNAHLVGLHTLEAMLVYPGIAMHIPGPVFSAFNENQKKEAEKIKSVFASHTDNEEFQSEFRLLGAEATTATERIVESARAADLVIMAREDKDLDRSDQREAQGQVIRHSGRPVVIVPPGYDGPEIGRNIIVGWSETREAARAAHDLIDLAYDGAQVSVLRVGHSQQDPMQDYDGISLVETMSRHGLKPSLEYREASGDGVVDVLNKVAFEKGADLIVTGAFGHSKAYDFVIGATTYALLKEAQLPVMYSK